MDSYETETIDEVTDEVARIARTAMDAIDRISRSTRDPASIQAARLSLGAVLLAQVVTSEAAANTVNAIWKARGWRMVRVH